MRLALSLVVALGSLPALASSVLVVPSDEARAQGLGDVVVDVLGAAGVTVKLAGANAPVVGCARETNETTRRGCLAEYATRATTSTVLLVTVSEEKRQLRATLELVAQASGKELKTFRIKAPAERWQKQATSQLRGLARLALAQQYVAREVERELPPVAEEPARGDEPRAATEDTPPVAPREEAPAREDTARRAGPEPEPVRPDRPVDTRLTPGSDDPEMELEDSGPSHAAAWTFTGVGLVSAAVATTVGLIGLAGKSRLESAPNGLSTLSYGQALELRGASNGQLTVALVAGLVAIVTGTVAGLLWGLDR